MIEVVVGVLIGIELLLRTVNHLYVNKNRSMANREKHERPKKKINKNREKTKENRKGIEKE